MLLVYIGASFTCGERIKLMAIELENRGYTVLSKWFDLDYFVEKAWDKNFNGEVAETIARVDLSQILQANLIIIDSGDLSSTGGYHVETGMAIMLAFFRHIRVVHIGPRNNIFQKLIAEHYDTWEHFLNVGVPIYRGELK